MEWIYNEDQDAYLAGEARNGCGVFKNLWPDEIHWGANVVYGQNIISLGNFATKEQAMEEAEKELTNLRIKNGEEI